MSKYKIEKGVALSAIDRKGRAYYSKYPFSRMEVGDSFEMAIEDYRKIVSASVSFRRSRPDHRFAFRRNGNTARCWRIQ